MARIRTAVLILAIATASLVPTPSGQAVPARPRFVSDCIDQTTLIPMTRQQAQTYLPEGFSPVGGVVGQGQQVYFEFMSLRCGDLNLPTLELVVAFVGVEAPERYSNDDTPERFIIDMVGEGSSLPGMSRALCMENVAVHGEVSSTHTMNRTEFGSARGSSTVESPVLFANFNLAASGTDSTAGGAVRWLYERDGKIDYFDSAYSVNFTSIGSSTVRFLDTYLDFPPVAQGFGFYDAYDQMMFVPPPGCRRPSPGSDR
jgi:hypothetical protein